MINKVKTEKEFEETIARLCGVAMLGLKAASVMCCKHCDYPFVLQQVTKLNRQFNGCDIYFKIIHYNEFRSLVLVYRGAKLEAWLKKKENCEFLQQYGYPANGNLQNMLLFLRFRIEKEKILPPEIGVFLGFPLEDVIGFIKKPGAHKYCGCWCVYHHVDEKIKIFEQYKMCTEKICQRLAAGEQLEQIFGIAS